MHTEIHLPHDHGYKTSTVLKTMPEQETFDRIASTFDLISDPTRVKILWLLCHTEDCVANIAAAVEMSSPAVSHHLRVFKQAGLLAHRKNGKEVYYTLADTDEARQIHHIVDIVFNLNCKERY
jgi:DNA-binding transcriptional ArsR family regulator